MKYAIVTKINATQTAPFRGFVKPYIIEDDNSYRVSKDDEFPNRNSIFITGGYNELDEKFTNNELFRIPFEEADNYEELNPNSSLYAAHGRNATPLGQWDYFYVIDKDIDYKQLEAKNIVFKPLGHRIYIISAIGNYLLGPFNYGEPQFVIENNTYQVKLHPYPHLPTINSLNDWHALKIPYNSYPVISVGEAKILVAKLDDISKNEPEIIDYISDEQLLKWGNDWLASFETTKEKGLAKRQLRSFQSAIEQLPVSDTDFFKERRKRLIETLDKTNLWIEQRSILINDFLSTDTGKKQVELYLESIKDSLEDQWRSKNQEKEEEAKSRLNDIENKISKKRDELENINQVLEQTKEEINIQKRDELDQENQSLMQQIRAKKQDLEEILSKINIGKEIDELKNERYYLQRENDEAKEKQRELKNDVESLQRTMTQLSNQNANEMKKRLNDLKPYIDLLNGIVPFTSKESRKNYPVIVRDNVPSDVKELVQEIVDKLKRYDRDYEFEDVVNFLISIHQNFLTMFAGLPGTGKTSLATYLAKVIGLTDQKRFQSVAVARGWTSQRDIIGFYNPLSGTFQASSTGLYPLLKQGHWEYQEKKEMYPIWVLLDEANLSPIEHYWSSFLDMCDPHSPRILQNNDPEVNGNLTIPESVRFIGTINYDNTTEPLSPRIIDRVPIIKLHPSKKPIVFENFDSNELEQEKIIPYKDFKLLFNIPSDQKELTQDERRMLEKIIEILSSPDAEFGTPIIISPRKQRLIRDYCGMARKLLEESYPLRGFDFAVAQYILPTINGSGPKYRNRLEKLKKDVINQLDYSSSMLERIIDIGENEHQFFRFFV
ncbi:MAG: AAA family ATPase [Anaerolineales bacterium]|nr:AAA family ATPase [Anaerolineales bacterium]